MESIVRYESKPILHDPVFIEALPGIGNVGKIAGDFLANAFKAVKFASLYSDNFPPQVIPDQNCVVKMACNELWYAKAPDGRDVIFLRGDYQGSTPEGQFLLAEDVMELLLAYNTKLIITLGGYGTGTMIDEPHVYGAMTRRELRPMLEEAGVDFNPGEPQTGIVGAAGVLLGLGQINNVDAVCLMGETSGFFADHKSARAIVLALQKMFKADNLDLKALDEQSQQIEELTAKVKDMTSDEKRDLNYIG